MPGYVADASVVAKLLLEEPFSANAKAFFLAAAEPDVGLWAPDLLFAECANVLWKHVQRGHLQPASALDDLTALLRLPLHTAPTRELLLSAFGLAAAHSITAYDACYAALAQREGAVLVTADEKLLNSLSGTGCSVRHLREFR